LPEALQPSEVQQKAADNLVHMLDLAPAENREMLQPEGTMNPILQRYYNFLHARALNSEADVPPIDEALHSIVEPDPELLPENSFAIQRFCTQFPLTPNFQVWSLHFAFLLLVS
jgi:ATP-dependent DNA helicase 2 subunit 2